MKFAHFAHIWGKTGMTPHQRYEQLWRELALADEIGFDYGFCVEHHFRPDESWMSSPGLYFDYYWSFSYLRMYSTNIFSYKPKKKKINS